jgi:hypothetical protein
MGVSTTILLAYSYPRVFALDDEKNIRATSGLIWNQILNCSALHVGCTNKCTTFTSLVAIRIQT